MLEVLGRDASRSSALLEGPSQLFMVMQGSIRVMGCPSAGVGVVLGMASENLWKGNLIALRTSATRVASNDDFLRRLCFAPSSRTCIFGHVVILLEEVANIQMRVLDMLRNSRSRACQQSSQSKHSFSTLILYSPPWS
jgi:hypothetical protein